MSMNNISLLPLEEPTFLTKTMLTARYHHGFLEKSVTKRAFQLGWQINILHGLRIGSNHPSKVHKELTIQIFRLSSDIMKIGNN